MERQKREEYEKARMEKLKAIDPPPAGPTPAGEEPIVSCLCLKLLPLLVMEDIS